MTLITRDQQQCHHLEVMWSAAVPPSGGPYICDWEEEKYFALCPQLWLLPMLRMNWKRKGNGFRNV